MSDNNDITIINTRSGDEDEKGLDIRLKEENLREQAKNARELFNTIQDELDHREEDLKDGLSFLDMKNDTLLSYMIDVCNIVIRQVRGETIEGHKSVERCVEYRVILEKIKAIDQKLAYQLNKLITLPENANLEDQKIDVRNLDINLDNLNTHVEGDGSSDDGDHSEGVEGDEAEDSAESVANVDDSSGESDKFSDISENSSGDDKDENEDTGPEKVSRGAQKPNKAASGVYKPPKLRSVAYTEEGSFKKGDKGRRKNYDEFYQDEEPGAYTEPTRNEDDERTRFEEDNYTRLPDENPKKAKRKLKTKEYRRKKFKRGRRR